MITNYQDAKDYLHIAENAFNAQAYQESAEIVENVARYVAYQGKSLTTAQRAELTKETQKAIGLFTFCPDECLWEETSALMDLFED